MRFRLYCGIVKDGEWYNYSEVVPLMGGVLSVLEGVEKTGASRVLNLMKGSIKSIFTEDGKEERLDPQENSEHCEEQGVRAEGDAPQRDRRQAQRITRQAGEQQEYAGHKKQPSRRI